MGSTPQDRGGLITAALLSLAGQTSGTLNPYLRHHLSGHVALCNQWAELGTRPDVVDRLDAEALASDVLQHALGRMSLPVSVAATVFTLDHIRMSASSNRSLLRQLATARLLGFVRPGGGIASWVLK
jgi:hypothetical protein